MHDYQGLWSRSLSALVSRSGQAGGSDLGFWSNKCITLLARIWQCSRKPIFWLRNCCLIYVPLSRVKDSDMLKTLVALTKISRLPTAITIPTLVMEIPNHGIPVSPIRSAICSSVPISPQYWPFCTATCAEILLGEHPRGYHRVLKVQPISIYFTFVLTFQSFWNKISSHSPIILQLSKQRTASYRRNLGQQHSPFETSRLTQSWRLRLTRTIRLPSLPPSYIRHFHLSTLSNHLNISGSSK